MDREAKIWEQYGDRLKVFIRKDFNEDDTDGSWFRHLRDVFHSADPTPNVKYLRWLVETYLNQGFRWEDISYGEESKVGETLFLFHKHKSKLPIEMRSLNKYSSIAEMWNAIEQFYTIDDSMNRKEEREKAYAECEIISPSFFNIPENTSLKIISPKTEFSSKWFGRGTRWCTASKNNNMFSRYNNDAPLFIIFMPNGDKLQLWKNKNDIQFMDASDAVVSKKYIRENWDVLEGICNWTGSIHYMLEENINMDICKAHVKRKLQYHLLFLQEEFFKNDIPDKFLTEELYLYALEQSSNSIQYIPEEQRTLKMCEFIVRKDPSNIRYVPDHIKTNETYKMLIKQKNYRDCEISHMKYCDQNTILKVASHITNSLKKHLPSEEAFMNALMRNNRIDFSFLKKFLNILNKRFNSHYKRSYQNQNPVPDMVDTLSLYLCRIIYLCRIHRLTTCRNPDKGEICISEQSLNKLENLLIKHIKKGTLNIEVIPDSLKTEEYYKYSFCNNRNIDGFPDHIVTKHMKWLNKSTNISREIVQKVIFSDMEEKDFYELLLENKQDVSDFMNAIIYYPDICEKYIDSIIPLLSIVYHREIKDEAVRNYYYHMVIRHNIDLYDFPSDFFTEETAKIAVETDGSNISLIPEHLRTKELYMTAIKQNGYALGKLPPEYVTPETCKIAVESVGNALQFVKDEWKTKELCELAIQTSGYAISSIPEEFKTEEVCETAIRNYGTLHNLPRKHLTYENIVHYMKINNEVPQEVISIVMYGNGSVFKHLDEDTQMKLIEKMCEMDFENILMVPDNRWTSGMMEACYKNYHKKSGKSRKSMENNLAKKIVKNVNCGLRFNYYTQTMLLKILTMKPWFILHIPEDKMTSEVLEFCARNNIITMEDIIKTFNQKAY